MLVLSRKLNEEIIINGNIKVSVLKIKGNVVRIGIEAPAEVGIKRGELCDIDIAESVREVAEEKGGYQLVSLSDVKIDFERGGPNGESVDPFAESTKRGRLEKNCLTRNRLPKVTDYKKGKSA